MATTNDTEIFRNDGIEGESVHIKQNLNNNKDQLSHVISNHEELGKDCNDLTNPKVQMETTVTVNPEDFNELETTFDNVEIKKNINTVLDFLEKDVNDISSENKNKNGKVANTNFEGDKENCPDNNQNPFTVIPKLHLKDKLVSENCVLTPSSTYSIKEKQSCDQKSEAKNCIQNQDGNENLEDSFNCNISMITSNYNDHNSTENDLVLALEALNINCNETDETFLSCKDEFEDSVSTLLDKTVAQNEKVHAEGTFYTPYLLNKTYEESLPSDELSTYEINTIASSNENEVKKTLPNFDWAYAESKVSDKITEEKVNTVDSSDANKSVVLDLNSEMAREGIDISSLKIEETSNLNQTVEESKPNNELIGEESSITDSSNAETEKKILSLNEPYGGSKPNEGLPEDDIINSDTSSDKNLSNLNKIQEESTPSNELSGKAMNSLNQAREESNPKDKLIEDEINVSDGSDLNKTQESSPCNEESKPKDGLCEEEVINIIDSLNGEVIKKDLNITYEESKPNAKLSEDEINSRDDSSEKNVLPDLNKTQQTTPSNDLIDEKIKITDLNHTYEDAINNSDKLTEGEDETKNVLPNLDRTQESTPSNELIVKEMNTIDNSNDKTEDGVLSNENQTYEESKPNHELVAEEIKTSGSSCVNTDLTQAYEESNPNDEFVEGEIDITDNKVEMQNILPELNATSEESKPHDKHTEDQDEKKNILPNLNKTQEPTPCNEEPETNHELTEEVFKISDSSYVKTDLNQTCERSKPIDKVADDAINAIDISIGKTENNILSTLNQTYEESKPNQGFVEEETNIDNKIEKPELNEESKPRDKLTEDQDEKKNILPNLNKTQEFTPCSEESKTNHELIEEVIKISDSVYMKIDLNQTYEGSKPNYEATEDETNTSDNSNGKTDKNNVLSNLNETYEESKPNHLNTTYEEYKPNDKLTEDDIKISDDTSGMANVLSNLNCTREEIKSNELIGEEMNRIDNLNGNIGKITVLPDLNQTYEESNPIDQLTEESSNQNVKSTMNESYEDPKVNVVTSEDKINDSDNSGLKANVLLESNKTQESTQNTESIEEEIKNKSIGFNNFNAINSTEKLLNNDLENDEVFVEECSRRECTNLDEILAPEKRTSGFKEPRREDYDLQSLKKKRSIDISFTGRPSIHKSTAEFISFSTVMEASPPSFKARAEQFLHQSDYLLTINDLQKKVSMLTFQLCEKQNELLKNNRKSLDDKTSTMETRCEELERTVKYYQEELQKALSKIKSITENYQKDAQALRVFIAEKSEKINENDFLKRKVEELTNQNQELEKNLTKFKLEANRHIIVYQENYKISQMKVKDITEARDKLKSELDNFKKEYEALATKYQKCRSIAVGFKENQEALINDMKERERIIKTLGEQYEYFKTQASLKLNEANEEVMKLKKQLAEVTPAPAPASTSASSSNLTRTRSLLRRRT